MGLLGLIVDGVMDANKAIKQNKAVNDDSLQNVVIENRYSIDIPSFLSPTNKLSEDASLQYWNKTLDVAFQIIDEPKDEVLEAIETLDDAFIDDDDDDNDDDDEVTSMLDKVATMALTNIFDMDKSQITDYTVRTINGLKAVTMNVFQKRSFFKDASYGSFAFIEGADTIYQIMIISGGTSIAKLADKLEASIMSFREL